MSSSGRFPLPLSSVMRRAGNISIPNEAESTNYPRIQEGQFPLSYFYPQLIPFDHSRGELYSGGSEALPRNMNAHGHSFRGQRQLHPIIAELGPPSLFGQQRNYLNQQDAPRQYNNPFGGRLGYGVLENGVRVRRRHTCFCTDKCCLTTCTIFLAVYLMISGILQFSVGAIMLLKLSKNSSKIPSLPLSQANALVRHNAFETGQALMCMILGLWLIFAWLKESVGLVQNWVIALCVVKVYGLIMAAEFRRILLANIFWEIMKLFIQSSLVLTLRDEFPCNAIPGIGQQNEDPEDDGRLDDVNGLEDLRRRISSSSELTVSRDNESQAHENRRVLQAGIIGRTHQIHQAPTCQQSIILNPSLPSGSTSSSSFRSAMSRLSSGFIGAFSSTSRPVPVQIQNDPGCNIQPSSNQSRLLHIR